MSMLDDKENFENFSNNYTEESPNILKINISNFYYFRPNKTKQLDADYTREQIKNLNVACGDIKNIKEPEKITHTNFIVFYLTENVIGKVGRDSISSALTSIYSKRCDTDTQLTKVIDLLNIK